MMLSLTYRRVLAVVLGFSAFMGISLLVAFVVGMVSPQSEACVRQCVAHGKVGVLVYKGPASPKPRNSLYDVFTECQCR